VQLILQLEFKELLVLYTSVTLFISLVLMGSSSKVMHRKNRKSELVLAISIIMVTLPGLLYKVQYLNSFADADPDAYLHDMRLIVKVGSIPLEKLDANPYYRAYPIFELLLSLINITTSFDPSYSYMLLNTTSIVLVSIYLLKLFPKSIGCEGNGLAVLIGALMFLGNIYTYGKWWNSFLPAMLGQVPLIMSLTMMFRSRKTDFLVILLLLSLGLVHSLTLLIYFSILLLYVVYSSYEKRGVSKFSSSSNGSAIRWERIIMPLVIWLTYLVYSYAMAAIISAAEDLWTHIVITLTEVEQGLAIASPTERPFILLNAIGPSLIVGITISYLINALYLRLVKHIETNALLDVISLSSIFLIGISSIFQFLVSSRLYWSGAGFYPSIYGFFLSMMASVAITREKISGIDARSSRLSTRIALFVLLVFIILAPIGGLSDPFAFPTPANSPLLDESNVARLRYLAGFMGEHPSSKARIMAEVKDLFFIHSLAYDNIILPMGTRTRLMNEFKAILNEPTYASFLNVYTLLKSDSSHADKLMKNLSLIYDDGYWLFLP